MKVVAIIQARMGSTRLPGKIMKEVLEKPLIEYQIERIRNSRLIDKIVIATTTKIAEQPIVDLCEGLSVDYYRGSEVDVLSRYYEAAKLYDADVIVRLTSDCPIIDPIIIDKVIKEYINSHSDYDYVSNTLERTYPRGMDIEVFSFESLGKAYKNAVENRSREHVTPYIQSAKSFRLKNVTNYEDKSIHRWTVDTPEDFELIKRILIHLYPIHKTSFNYNHLLDLVERNPEWSKLNAHIEQKKV